MSGQGCGLTSEVIATMSIVTNQPLPYGRLERENHIRMIFRAFQNKCGPVCECHSHPPACKSLQMSGKPVPGLLRSEDGAGGSSNSLSVLDEVTQFHVTARPQLQGPQCVPQRIYSIATGASRSQLFVVVEESSCVCLQCCGPARSCSLQGFDQQGHQVFYFDRPLRMDACCLGCCLMEMSAYTGQKQLIGTVYQRWSMFTPFFEVKDSQGTAAVQIQGPCCPIRCLSNQQFQIVSNIGENVGTIWKKWPGFHQDHNMDHEYFGMEVPPGMDSQTKLLLLAATFLLNYMFFEMS
ncbi:phospholipid scramblase family member 5 isoform X1 [Hippocampus comes]|uniref:phospholipid scramblase family member 5 isoform X1 n=2 Tax=Hippocampus comes TaxID=109280 RepID=UPI00094EDB20|nr:PREDICTED: phospholipid scramblase family member 5-like isoform X1 [Hippocampus comes]